MVRVDLKGLCVEVDGLSVVTSLASGVSLRMEGFGLLLQLLIDLDMR